MTWTQPIEGRLHRGFQARTRAGPVSDVDPAKTFYIEKASFTLAVDRIELEHSGGAAGPSAVGRATV